MSGQTDMRKVKENEAVKLMKAGTKKKKALELAGLDYTPGDKNYHRVCKRFYRWEAQKEKAKINAKIKQLKSTVQKQTKQLLTAAQRRESMQQLRREANLARAEFRTSEFKRKEMSRTLEKLDKKCTTHSSHCLHV